MNEARAAMLAALLPAAGCVTGSYNHVSVDEPIRAEQLAELQPGGVDLTRCLQVLGAPHRVLEYQVAADGRAGMALVWVWRDVAGWGVDVSVAYDDASGSVSFDSQQTDLPGCVLWFDPDLRLERWRTGTLGDLLPTRRRPAPFAGG
ncbi:MAG: hypothetical protein MUC36_09865 [Planctomycetes bacterium]|nr:hypothetical protein [Planctomycetota bacterium]